MSRTKNGRQLRLLRIDRGVTIATCTFGIVARAHPHDSGPPSVGLAMSSAPGQKRNKAGERLAAIDQLLIAGIKHGPAKKREAINRILELVPEWRRGDCWQRIRHLRKAPELAALEESHPDKAKRSGETVAGRRPASRPWTPADDDRLLNWAGYEPVKKIAQRLGRSTRAVRFRLGALGMSAKVTDGWSLRALRKMLHVSPARLRYLIGNGMLRVRDPRVSTSSLAVVCDKNRVLEPSVHDRVAAALFKGEEGYMWERAADLLGVTVTQVQSWICAGQLRVVDTFVTDRSFEEFCKKHGTEVNTALMDPATAKWLVKEYGVPDSASKDRAVSRAQKHALTIRTCKCGKKIAGNVYFMHIKACSAASGEATRKAI